MKKILLSILMLSVLLTSFGMVTAVNYNDQISFLYEDNFEGVSGDTSGWSTNDATVYLDTSNWPLDFGVVKNVMMAIMKVVMVV